MGETLSFKVFLRSQLNKNKKEGRKEKEKKDGGIKEDVRRFVLDRESADLGKIKLKISECYPELADKDYFLTWTDCENDNVTIASDDDLTIAIMEMPGPVYSIQINVKKHNRITNTFGLDDKGIKSRKKKRYGLKTEYSGKGHGKDAKKQKQSNGYSKKKRQRSFNLSSRKPFDCA